MTFSHIEPFSGVRDDIEVYIGRLGSNIWLQTVLVWGISLIKHLTTQPVSLLINLLQKLIMNKLKHYMIILCSVLSSIPATVV